MEHTGTARNGTFIPVYPKVWEADLRRCDGMAVVLKVKLDRLSRSDNQNKFLWGVVYAVLADYTGHTTEEIHEYCKSKFLPPETICVSTNEGPEEVSVPRSTAKLNIAEFSEYVNQIQMWAADKLGVVIPDANQEP